MKTILCIILFMSTYLYADSTSVKTIHIVIALCDNENQGIVPVPAHLGNGRVAKNNLYWGAMYGLKTVMQKNNNWIIIKTIIKPDEIIAERIILRHNVKNCYLIADAYYGDHIYEAVQQFVNYTYGNDDLSIEVGDFTLFAGGNSDLIIYAGHNGLMEFDLDELPIPAIKSNRNFAILACISKDYFSSIMEKSGAHPLIWTTGLMAPEGYVVEAIVDGWALGRTNQEIRQLTAEAYHKYQNCGVRAAKRLFVTGW